jgi:hypothetical protein
LIHTVSFQPVGCQPTPVARRQQFVKWGYELDGEHPDPAIRAQLDLAKRIGGGITDQSDSGWERGVAKAVQRKHI